MFNGSNKNPIREDDIDNLKDIIVIINHHRYRGNTKSDCIETVIAVDFLNVKNFQTDSEFCSIRIS